jgi:4-amino-4-deoxy-L-arabinose transferase-like glycosyltransferase
MSRRATAIVFLLGLCAATMMTGLGRTSLFEPDEPRFAEATRQMLERGDLLTPYFNGQPRFEKPILFYWMQLPFFAVLGPGELAARLPAAICGTLAVFLLWAIGRRLFSDRAAWLGAVALATSFRFVTYARQGLTDVPVLLFEMLALWAFLRASDGPTHARRFTRVAWAAIGLAALTKGPVAALPLLVWIPYLALTRQVGAIRWRDWIAGAGLAALIAAPWYLYMIAVHGHAYFDHGVGYELVRRYADTEFPGPKRGVFYYFGVWPGDLAPWTFVFLAALAWVAWRWRGLTEREQRGASFCIVWFVVVLAVFSSASGKLPHYLLPLYPPAALLVGYFAHDATGAASRGGAWLWRVASWVTLTALLAVAVVLALFLQRGFAVPALSLAMVVPALVAFGAIAGAVLEARSNRPGVIVAIAATLAAAYAIVGLHVAPTYLQDMQPVSRLGGIIAAEAGVHDRVAHFGGFGAPGLVFYSRHNVEHLRSPEEVAQFLEGDGRRFCVVSAGDLEAVRRVASREPHVLARQPLLTIRFMRVLRGRPPNPDRALVLVSNSPATGARRGRTLGQQTAGALQPALGSGPRERDVRASVPSAVRDRAASVRDAAERVQPGPEPAS